MQNKKKTKRIAIIGGGPSGLFMFKKLVELKQDIEITIFERKLEPGMGMPYGKDGACLEHITNVSDNEIPPLETTVEEWCKTAPIDILAKFKVDPNRFNEYKVLPRLFFGYYLAAQFELLMLKARKLNQKFEFLFQTEVIDLIDCSTNDEIKVLLKDNSQLSFDHVIICTGHNWPNKLENKIPGYFDSPYPPSKLKLKINHSIAIKGSSLTAIDAIRTLARENGKFEVNANGKLIYVLAEGQNHFELVMHSRNGFLPAVRFHLTNSQLKNKNLLSPAQIINHRHENGGFVSLDYIFEHNFKNQFIDKHIEFYHQIKDFILEDFVAHMMSLREKLDPFVLLKAEYAEAQQSIKRHETIYWKELLANLSFALNYPAKYFSAEDMLRLQKSLMPLISIVIAFVPQSSCEELLALYEAGLLKLISVGDDSEIKPIQNGGVVYNYFNENGEKINQHYSTFIDCVGQPHLNITDFPFKQLVKDSKVTAAQLKFKSSEMAEKIIDNNDQVMLHNDGAYYLNVAGIGINDNFQVIDKFGAYNKRIYIMAVPYIGGFNPDYSGLDFCDEASNRIANSLAQLN